MECIFGNSMKNLLILLIVLLISGCVNESLEKKSTDNSHIPVEKLFTYDGCVVYRFFDGGSARYFTNCKGTTSWQESCGKSCTKKFSVMGGQNDSGSEIEGKN